MAYVAFGEQFDGAALTTASLAIPADQSRKVSRAMEGFSALEWSVVAIAESDKLSSLRQPGRMAVAMGTLFGDRHNPRLADPRLEALRRMAVLSWHHGFVVPGHAVRDFTAAGYTLDQYETLVASIGAARARRQRRTRR
jgi:hypothetical protein